MKTILKKETLKALAVHTARVNSKPYLADLCLEYRADEQTVTLIATTGTTCATWTENVNCTEEESYRNSICNKTLNRLLKESTDVGCEHSADSLTFSFDNVIINEKIERYPLDTCTGIHKAKNTKDDRKLMYDPGLVGKVGKSLTHINKEYLHSLHGGIEGLVLAYRYDQYEFIVMPLNGG